VSEHVLMQRPVRWPFDPERIDQQLNELAVASQVRKNFGDLHLKECKRRTVPFRAPDTPSHGVEQSIERRSWVSVAL